MTNNAPGRIWIWEEVGKILIKTTNESFACYILLKQQAGTIEYVRKDIADDAVADAVILQKQVLALEDKLENATKGIREVWERVFGKCGRRS